MEELKKDDVKEAENLPISDEQDMEDNSTETENVEEAITGEEPEVQTTFTDFAAEEMIDEEGSVENVSD